MYKFVLSESPDGYDTYVDLIASPAGQYLSRRPHLATVIREMLATNKLHGKRMVIERDMGHEIGTTDVVTTTDVDNIYYARAAKSEVYSRFAKNRYPQTSSILTVVAILDKDGNYEIHDAWIGANHPAFPGDEQATKDSTKYWQTHALVQDAVVIQSATITRTCPY